MRILTQLIVTFCLVFEASGESIRSFNLSTLHSLGTEIFLQDGIAADATQVMQRQRTDLSRFPVRGWIIERSGSDSVVTFVADYNGDYKGVFEVRKRGKRRGRFSMLDDQALTETQLAQFRARILAEEHIDRECSTNYNFFVLPDIGSDGFLVYALAATPNPDWVMVGGHYRMMITPDGKSLRQNDKLFKSCLVLNKKPADLPPEAELHALYMSHVVSETPVETHVFLSLLHGLTLYVTTPDGQVWEVTGRHIRRF